MEEEQRLTFVSGHLPSADPANLRPLNRLAVNRGVIGAEAITGSNCAAGCGHRVGVLRSEGLRTRRYRVLWMVLQASSILDKRVLAEPAFGAHTKIKRHTIDLPGFKGQHLKFEWTRL
jgi:hypothetical protein